MTFVPGQVKGIFTCLKDKCLKKVNVEPLNGFYSNLHKDATPYRLCNSS